MSINYFATYQFCAYYRNTPTLLLPTPACGLCMTAHTRVVKGKMQKTKDAWRKWDWRRGSRLGCLLLKTKCFYLFPAMMFSLIKEQQPARLLDLQTDQVAFRLAQPPPPPSLHKLSRSYALSNTHTETYAATQKQHTRRQKWVRLTGSLSLHLKNATGSRCFALDTMDAKRHS